MIDGIKIYHFRGNKPQSSFPFFCDHISMKENLSRGGLFWAIYNFLDKKRQKYRHVDFTVAVKDGKLGIAICSDKDQFSRKRGREIAMGRLNKCPVYVFEMDFSENKEKESTDVLL